MKRLFNKNRIAGMVIAILFLLCGTTVVLIHLNPGYERFVPTLNSFLIAKPESVEQEVINGYAGVRRTYTFTLPEQIYTGMSLRFYLRHTYTAFYMEDSSLAAKPVELDEPHIGHTTGHYWMSIPLVPSLAGETIHVVLTPVYNAVRNAEPVFYYIDRDTLLTNIVLPEDQWMLFLSVVAIAAGLFITLLAATPDLTGDNRRNIFYMGTTTICAGVWKLCSLPVFVLLIDYMGIEKEVWYVGVSSYLLMLVLSLRLQISLRSDKGNRVTRVCFYVGTITAILIVALQLADITEIHNTLVWYGISMAMLHLISLFSQKPKVYELFWGFPFFITLGMDFLICLVKGTLRGAPFFLLWILLNLFVRGFGFLRYDIEHERQLRFKEVELKESRLRAMMNEIRPHFIHNTLTSIYMLCGEDPERAQEVVGDFAAYLQANFQAISATELTIFTKELEHTKAYVAVESILYEGKLTVEYDTAFTAFRLPPLTLQPIVENAIKYSVGCGRSQGHIIVHSHSENGNAIISVEDDGEGFTSFPSYRDDSDEIHVGLNNVRDRLEMMCRGTLEISPREGGGTIVTIVLPESVT